MESDEQRLNEFADAILIFSMGKQLVNHGEYAEGLDRLRQSFNLMGQDGARTLSNIFDNQTSDGYLAEYHELMGRAYHGLKDYDLALEHFNQWTELIRDKCGNNSVKLAKCYQWTGRTWRYISVYDKELSKLSYEGMRGLWQYIQIALNYSTREEKNMEQPVKYYKMAYELLIANNGSKAEVEGLKQEIVTFFCKVAATVHLIQTIVFSLAFIPLLVIVLLIWGFSMKSLAVFSASLGIFVLWRFIDYFIVFGLTYVHHQKKVI